MQLEYFTVTGGCIGRPSFLQTIIEFHLHPNLVIFLHYIRIHYVHIIIRIHVSTLIVCTLYSLGHQQLLRDHTFSYIHNIQISASIYMHIYDNIIHTYIYIYTYTICLHYCCLWTKSIECSSAQPTIETFVRVHPGEIYWTKLFYYIYNMVQKVGCDVLIMLLTPMYIS